MVEQVQWNHKILEVKWNTKADGTGTNYANGESVEISEDITLYAQWKIREYVLTYDANGGTGTVEGHSGVKNTRVTLRQNTFTRSMFEFKGWSTTSAMTDNSVIYQPGTELVLTDDVKLYAVWLLNPQSGMTIKYKGYYFVVYSYTNLSSHQYFISNFP